MTLPVVIVKENSVTTIGFPSSSLSAVPSVLTLPDTGVSSNVVFELSVAIGAVLFGLTKMDKIALSVNEPSLNMYEIDGTVPVNVLEGMKVYAPVVEIFIVPISVILIVPEPAV